MPVTLEDDAEFQCQVGAAEDGRVEPIRSRYATLTVLVPPTPPRIVHPSSQPVRTHTSLDSTSLPLHKTVEGRMVELVCESRGGKPAAEVSTIVHCFQICLVKAVAVCQSCYWFESNESCFTNQ